MILLKQVASRSISVGMADDRRNEEKKFKFIENGDAQNKL
jgi:hypothetical protein